MGFGDVVLLPIGGSVSEDVLVDAAGRLFAGLEDGRVVRLDGPEALVHTFATVPGRPLGLEFLGSDELLVCASDAGLPSVSLDGGQVCTLVDGSATCRCSRATTRRSPRTSPSTSPTPPPATACRSGAAT